MKHFKLNKKIHALRFRQNIGQKFQISSMNIKCLFIGPTYNININFLIIPFQTFNVFSWRLKTCYLEINLDNVLFIRMAITPPTAINAMLRKYQN